MFTNANGKFDMSLVWSAISAFSIFFATVIIGSLTLFQNHRHNKESKQLKEKDLLLNSGFIMVHDYPKIENGKITIWLRNIKHIAIVKCDNISVKIDEKEYNFNIGGGYLTNGTLDCNYMFPIECSISGNFIEHKDYNFTISLILKSEKRTHIVTCKW